jgi:coenzyme Q-binding protein COQ10
MPSIRKVRILPYESSFLRDLVLDIESYCVFLPWCRSVHILETGKDYRIAEMVICYKALKERYVSRVDHVLGSHDIHVNLVSGPFSHLVTKWHFVPLDAQQTELHFFIDFSFKNKILSMILEPFFFQAMQRIMDSFEQRADFLMQQKMEQR